MIRLLSSDTNQLWKVLKKENSLSWEQFSEALRRAKHEDRHITHILLETPDLQRDKVLQALSAHYSVPVVTLRKRVISPYVINLIPKEVAEAHSVVIFKKLKNVISVATTAPENVQTIEFIRRKTGLEPEVYLTTPDEIEHALKKYQSDIITEFARIIKESTQHALATHDSAEKMAQFVPIITMADTLVERALTQQASDIHLEPTRQKVIVRYRVDGLLMRIVELPIELLPPLVARIKLLANLKIDEHRLPQDGRFSFSFNDREVAVRVSVIPTLNGTKVVLRLLDTTEKRFSLKSLGFNRNDLQILRGEITQPHGMILVTGPTGSGKTTTLYTLLRLLNKETVNICTIEDPIEYGIESINQTQVNPNAGLTFANGLRSLLRQDPNIIMVGEIRDRETADMAINAAMTGHLVLSTLHTNNAFLALQRLVEMGIEPFMAASIINVVIGQRLVRKVCASCSVSFRLSEKIMEQYRTALSVERAVRKLQKNGLLPETLPLGGVRLSRGRGCSKCNGTGYLGRIGIYEVLKMTEALHGAIVADPSAVSLQQTAVNSGTLTTVEDGILKVLTGLTTFDEVLRVTK
ncbi:MAG: type II/IV secretion system protein [Candidatus Kerfeldbacteria bacterium]|nr:type II/IV secretion system protein [Candidatus Kerfeldbacteria bacterium]